MSELTVHLFSEGRVSFIRKAIENNSQSTNYEKYRKQRTDAVVNAMSKHLSEQQLEKFKAMAESFNDNEFNEVCKKADIMADMLCGK